MSSVFISYVSEDSATVNKLAEQLRSFGVQVWLDKTSITPGLPFREVINQAIRNGAFFLACFSRASSERDRSYMYEEINVAIDELRQRTAAKPWFLSVRLDDCPIPEIRINSVYTLRDLQWIDLFRDWNSGIKQLVRTINPFGNIDCIREALKLFGVNDYSSARSMLQMIASAGVDLPPRVKYLLHYNLACAESRLADGQRGDGKKQDAMLDSAVNHLDAWLGFGAGGAWTALDRTPDDEVHAMAHDDDLLYVRSMRKTRIEQSIRRHLRREFSLPSTPTGRSGGGCVVRGTVVLTSTGPLLIEKLRIGDTVLSYNVDTGEFVDTRVASIHVGRRYECVALNDSLHATLGHRLFVRARGWIPVQALSVGDHVFASEMHEIQLGGLTRKDGYFEIFAISTDHETHNYFTDGLLSHNMKE